MELCWSSIGLKVSSYIAQLSFFFSLRLPFLASGVFFLTIRLDDIRFLLTIRIKTECDLSSASSRQPESMRLGFRFFPMKRVAVRMPIYHIVVLVESLLLLRNISTLTNCFSIIPKIVLHIGACKYSQKHRHRYIYIYIYMVFDQKVFAKYFNCEYRSCYVGNPPLFLWREVT